MQGPIPSWVSDAPLDLNQLDQFIQAAIDVADGAAVDLDAAVLSYLPAGAVADDDPVPIRETARWQITDQAAAEWAARKMSEAQSDIDTHRRQHAQWVAELDDWLRSATSEAVGERTFFEAKLEQYALQQRERTGKATTKVPSATLKTTHRRAAVAFVSDEEVLAWAKELVRCEPCRGTGSVEATPGLASDGYELCDPCAGTGAVPRHGDLVHVTEKVLVSEVREYVKPVPTPTGRHVLSLECGCELVDTLTGSLADLVSDDGQVWANRATVGILCPTHHTDQRIIHLEPEMRLEPREGDALVPGLGIEPEKITPKVTLTVHPGV